MSATETTPLLDIRHVTVSYSGLLAVNEVSLAVGEGEIVAVVGLNGAGKSSLLRGVSGLVPMRGDCFLHGQRISRLPSAARASRGLGHVPEGRRLFPKLSVMDNLRIGALGAATRGGDATIEKVITTQFPAVTRLLRQRGDSLSGGEQQLVAIARAMLAQPSVLMLDEPSLGLSPIATQGVSTIIQELADSGKGILLAEQNVNMALRLAQRIVVLAFGATVAVVETGDLRGSTSRAIADDIYRMVTQAAVH